MREFLRRMTNLDVGGRSTALAAVALLSILALAAQPASAALEIVSVTESADPASPGDTVTYTIEIAAPGTPMVQEATLQDLLPAGGIDYEAIQVSSSQGEVGLFQDPNTLEYFLRFDLGSMNIGGTATITIVTVLTDQAPEIPSCYVSSPGSLEGVYEVWPASDWGTAVDATGITAEMELVNDGSGSEGCSALQGFTAGNIALVDRGSCEFGAKGLNAQAAGASAVIIINNGGDYMINMGGGVMGGQVTIPAFMMSQDQGEILKAGLPGITATLSTSTYSQWILYHDLFLFDDANTSNNAPWVEGTTVMAATVEAPTAGFSYSPMAPEAGQSVMFTDESTGDIDTWAWDFDDGETSDMQNPTHAFAAADIYTVSLTVTNAGGSDQATMDVTVTEAVPTGPAMSIPAAARVEGVGAFFYSVATMFNSGASAKDVTVTYTPRADIGGDSMDHVVSVASMEMLTVEDPLGEWFGFGEGETAVGSLMFTPATAKVTSELMVQSVVLARNDDGSEYGQAFPAVATNQALMAGDTAYLASTVDAERTRVNFGAMGLADGTKLTVTPVDPLGTALGTPRTVNLDMGGNVAINNLDNQFNLSGAENYVVQVDVTAGSALVYNSVLDGNASFGGTSDPTTILPVSMGRETVTLMEIGSVMGYDEFSGSASVTNLSSTDADVDAYFYPAGSTDAEMTNLTIAAGATVGYEDLVGDLFGVEGVGTVVLSTVNQTEIMATGREFAIFRDESEEITGTAGQLMPGLTAAHLLMSGFTYSILGVQEFQGAQGLERSHLSAFNPGGEDVTLSVSLYDATGAMEGSATYTVPAGELFKVTSIISKLNGDQDGEPKRLEVSASGGVYALGYRVSQWGDPVTLAPMRHMQ